MATKKHDVKTRLSEIEYERVKKDMEKYGMNQSEYLRFMLLKKRIPKELNTPESLENHTREIEKLSNVISNLLNTKFPDDYIYYSDFENIAIEIKRLIRMEKELISQITDRK